MQDESQIVWLDTNSDTDSVTKIKLKPFKPYIKIFDDADDCFQYINMHSKIILIISSALCEVVVPLVHDVPSIEMIYIHNVDNSKYKDDSIKQLSSKVIEIYGNINQIIGKLFDENLLSLLPISIINPQIIRETSVRDLTTDQATFIWFQLLLETLLQMPQTTGSIQEMIDECVLNYENDEIERKKITEFQQTYSPDTCLRWYTRDTFLYRLLNRALRTQNINDIFRYRFYIKDLYQQLQNLSSSASLIDTTLPTLYRGQIITQVELGKLQNNINGFISVNTFFSTTPSCDVAANYSGCGIARPQFQSVIFEITVDKKKLVKPFADIHQYSCNADENEILFSMGTIFRIISVELFIDEIWLIKLILDEEEDRNVIDLITYFRKEINQTEHYLLTLGKFLYFMGDLDKAEGYYRLLLDQISSSVLSFNDDYDRNHLIATLYNGIGLINHSREYFHAALHNYKNALAIHSSLDPMDPFANTAIYNNIGNTLVDMGDYEKAFEMYNSSLELRLLYSSFIKDDPSLAQIYNNLAVCYLKKAEYARSIENYNKSIDIKLKYLPPNHPSLGTTYSNLSDAYRANSDHEMALTNCQKALDIHKLSLPTNHIDLAKTHNALATIYADIGNTTKAKENYEKALEIALSETPRKHLFLITLYNNIANIYMNESQYELAIQYYKRALDKIQSSHTTGDAVIYNNLGEIYRRLGDYTEALINHKKAIDIRILLYPSIDHPDLAESYHNVGTLFCDKGQYDTALEYFQLALEIKETVFTSNHSSLAKTYINMAETYRKKSNYIESMKYSEKALQIERQQSPINSSELATVYNNIGLTYLEEKRFELAMENFQQTLELQLKSLKSNDLSFSTTYINLATVHGEKNDYTSALAYLQRALNIKLQNLSPNHIEFGLLYNNIGAVYFKAQNFADARESFKHALGIYIQHSLSNNCEIAAIFNNIGALYQLEGEYQLAKENFENSLLFDLKSLPEDHPNILQTRQQISLLDAVLKE